MSKRLEGQVAIVTGSSQGIGAATAIRFAEEGATVVLCSRRRESLEEVANTIRENGGRARVEPLDVSNEAAWTEVVERVVAEEGRVDILVNNAVLMVPGMIEGGDTKAWHLNFKVTLDGVFFGMRAVMPHMRKQGGGSIVNVSSVCGLLGSPGTSGYSSAKAAVIQLTRNAALEGARGNIRVNCVVPGAFLTPATEAVIPTEEAQKATGKSVPLGRIGDPRECANAILFMASAESSYVTGQSLVVDGGRVCELNTGAADYAD